MYKGLILQGTNQSPAAVPGKVLLESNHACELWSLDTYTTVSPPEPPGMAQAASQIQDQCRKSALRASLLLDSQGCYKSTKIIQIQEH